MLASLGRCHPPEGKGAGGPAAQSGPAPSNGQGGSAAEASCRAGGRPAGARSSVAENGSRVWELNSKAVESGEAHSVLVTFGNYLENRGLVIAKNRRCGVTLIGPRLDPLGNVFSVMSLKMKSQGSLERNLPAPRDGLCRCWVGRSLCAWTHLPGGPGMDLAMTPLCAAAGASVSGAPRAQCSEAVGWGGFSYRLADCVKGGQWCDHTTSQNLHQAGCAVCVAEAPADSRAQALEQHPGATRFILAPTRALKSVFLSHTSRCLKNAVCLNKPTQKLPTCPCHTRCLKWSEQTCHRLGRAWRRVHQDVPGTLTPLAPRLHASVPVELIKYLVLLSKFSTK